MAPTTFSPQQQPELRPLSPANLAWHAWPEETDPPDPKVAGRPPQELDHLLSSCSPWAMTANGGRRRATRALGTGSTERVSPPRKTFRDFGFLFAWLFRQLLPFLRAGKLRLRQTDVSDLERNARLPTQKWVRGVERRGDLTTVTLGHAHTPDRLRPP